MNLNKPVNYTTKEFCTMAAILMVFNYIAQRAIRNFFFDAEYLHGVTALLGAAGWAVIYFRYIKKIDKKKNE